MDTKRTCCCKFKSNVVHWVRICDSLENYFREQKRRYNFDEEELNQFYLDAEMLDDVVMNCAQALPKLKTKNKPNAPTAGPRKPQDNYLLDFEYELNEALRNCIQQHQELMTFSEMLEDYNNFFILWKSFQTTFQLCNIVFTIIKTDATLIQYINFVGYIILSLMDLFQMCYFGEILKQQSSKVGTALLRCPWHLCGGQFRRRVSIILANTMKPLVLTGGKFFVLDFNKLTGVSASIHDPPQYTLRPFQL